MAAKTMSDSWRESVGHIWIMVPRTAKEVKQKGLDLEIDERVNSGFKIDTNLNYIFSKTHNL